MSRGQRVPRSGRQTHPGLTLLAVFALLLAACGNTDGGAPANLEEPAGVEDAVTTVTSAPIAAAPEGAEDAAELPFVGEFLLSPAAGPIGTLVTATGSGFDPNTELLLAWEDTTATWNADLVEGKFYGREFVTEPVPIATVDTDSGGAFVAEFEVPRDFGFTHNVTVHEGAQTLNRAAFRTEMQMSISPTSGPVGTPITVEVTGMGYGYLENSWQLTYDNSYTGWVSAVTTDGIAKAVIPAVGAPGTHVIQLTHGWSHVPYLNNQQSPRPDRPVFTHEFEVTEGPAVLPPPAEDQGLPVVMAEPPEDNGEPMMWTDLVSGPVGTPLVLTGRNLPLQPLELVWYRQEGSRVSGSGWSEVGVELGTVTPDDAGTFTFEFSALDDLGGPHRIEAIAGDAVVATTSFDIKPSAFAVENGVGPAGTMALFHVKGVGWTETANIYTVVYDNSYVGFACGFNSQGDIQIYLPLAGEPGIHYVDFYPAIYRGEDIRGAVNFRLPQLTYADDHPGEDLPAFRFVVEVTEN